MSLLLAHSGAHPGQRAGLMCVKAELLYDAAIVNAMIVVIERAAAMIDNSGRPSGTRPDRTENLVAP